jgi:hypothetical protein
MSISIGLGIIEIEDEKDITFMKDTRMLDSLPSLRDDIVHDGYISKHVSLLCILTEHV